MVENSLHQQKKNWKSVLFFVIYLLRHQLTNGKVFR